MSFCLVKFKILMVFIISVWMVLQVHAGDDPDSCFCQLKGEIDDCSCNIETLDSFNNYKVFPRLDKLLHMDYFRFYKVNMFKPCPFESDTIGKCGSKSCAVDECKEENIPPGLKQNGSNGKNHEKQKYTKEVNQEENCEDQNEHSKLDTHISEGHSEAFKDWKDHDEKQENFCEVEDEDSPDAVYYDLVRNPERFTGYSGPSAVNVWKLVYEQNCFKPDKFDMKHYMSDQENSKSNGASGESGLCLEKRVFFRMISGFHTSINVDVTANWLIPRICLEQRTFFNLISGMHTSINTHLCALYPIATTPFGEPTWGPNLEEFLKRFDPEHTWGEGPKRLKNLYFTYLVELRALVKAAPYLQHEDYYTGHDQKDKETKELVHDILGAAKTFSNHFEEDKLFQGDAKEMKETFKLHFRNISHIMDCVGCDKCRLWGKVQIQGMGTALKILFSGDSMSGSSTVTQQHKTADIPFQLTRGEIVALFNGFGRLSKSIHEIETFRKMMESR